MQSNGERVVTYPSQPFRVNLMVVMWLVVTALVILHMTDRRAGSSQLPHYLTALYLPATITGIFALWKGCMMSNYMRRDDRKREILQTALGRRQVGKKTFTTHQIAKAIGVKPSTHLRQILAELVSVGELDVMYVHHRNNVVKLVFKLSNDFIERSYGF